MKNTTKPTALELAGQIVAADASLAALKEHRADLRRQVDFLETQRDECERLTAAYALYVARGSSGKAEEDFWRDNAPERVEVRLKRVMEGGCPMLATITESGFESSGRQVFSSRQVELSLPALGQVKDDLAKAEADILAADIAVRELKASAAPALQSAADVAEAAFRAVTAEQDRIQAAIADSRDIDEVVGLRSQLDQFGLRLISAERKLIEARLALLNASHAATEAELRAGRERLAALEQEIKDANKRLLAERQGQWKLADTDKDVTSERTRLQNRRAELELAWQQTVTSRDVRTAAPLALTGR
jgi:flagellar motility protein MotE (MotC chaperone)